MRRLGSWCAAAFLVACNNVPPSQAFPATSATPDGAVHDAAVAPGRMGSAGSCGTSCAGQSAVSAAGSGGSTPVAPGADMDAGSAPEDPTEDSGVPPTPERDAGVGPTGRPIGVSECYSAASSANAATRRHWEVFRAGDFASRGAMIDALSSAAEAEPKQEEFALLLGLASLWRVAEPYGLESLDPVLTLDSITVAQRELERAYAMCPSDHRIPAWLGPIKIRMGRMLEDTALVDEGFAVLNQGIEHYPGFVLFSKLLVYADLPASDPDFRRAVDAVRENSVYCGTVASGLSSDPACHNHPRAAHNIEGSSVFMGDMYAKAQDRAAALAAYQSAKSAPTWQSWKYRELLEDRIATLDARMTALASPSTSDDLEPAWSSQIQCSLCHRD